MFMLGKKIRLAQMFKRDRMFIVPMDHSVTHGPIEGLRNYMETIRLIKDAGVDSIVLHKGLLKQIAENRDLAGFPYIMHLSASIGWDKHPEKKVLVADVEEAIQLGAMGVSVHINLNNDFSSNMIFDLGCVSRKCEQWGMPLLAMMYVSFDSAPNDYAHIIHAARLAEELGADIIKIPFPGEKYLDTLFSSVTIPTLISGGHLNENFDEVMLQIKCCMKAGFKGVAIGRNVFQYNDINDAVRKISNLVHEQ